jgi:hypothetical protein
LNAQNYIGESSSSILKWNRLKDPNLDAVKIMLALHLIENNLTEALLNTLRI